MNRILVILIIILLCEIRTNAQQLDDFEDDIVASDSQEDDGCEQEEGDGFAARFVYSTIRFLSQCISQLDAPDFGRFPYSEGSRVFRMNEPERQRHTPSYNSFSGGFQNTERNISTLTGEYRFAKNSFLLQFNLQNYQERLAFGRTDRMIMTQTKFGFTKLVGTKAVWSAFTGVPTLSGNANHAGVLVGSALKVYLTLPVAFEAEYVLNDFGKGAAFHEQKLGLSFFHRRMEWQAGYHWMNTLQGHSLNGAYLNLRYNL